MMESFGKDTEVKPKVSLAVQLKLALRPLSKKLAVLMQHAYFAFIMLLMLGVGTCIYFVAQAFNTSDEAYRQAKSQELTKSFRITEDKATVDRVLNLQTANAGPILPNYDPERDNPFFE